MLVAIFGALGFGSGMMLLAESGVATMIVGSLFVFNAFGIVNAIPMGGSDGDHFQQHLFHALAEYLGFQNSPKIAHHATNVVKYGIALAVFIGVVS